MNKILSIAGVGSWVAFIASASLTKLEVVRGPIEPLADPTNIGNVLFVLSLGLGLLSVVLFGIRISKLSGGVFSLWFGFSGAVLFCSILLIAALRYITYGA